MSFRVVLLGVVVGVLLLGGGLVWSGRDDFAALLDRTTPDEKPTCAALDDGERKELLGVDTPVTLLEAEGALDPYSCRWAVRDYKTTIAYVQAASVPADVWASEVAPQMSTLSTSGDPSRGRKLRRAALQPFDTAEAGCRFARLVYGSDRSVQPTTASSGTPMMMAQSCIDGTYTSVIVVADSLTLDRDLARRTREALKVVEARLG